MKTIKICLLMIFFSINCLSGISWASSTGDLSFSDALQILQSKNETLKAARLEEKQKEYEKSAAQGLYYPKLQLGIQYTQIDDPISIDLNDIRSVILGLHSEIPSSMIPSFEMQVQDDKYWKSSISAVWPVYMGGRIKAANRAADAFLDKSKEQLRSAEYSLTSELIKVYFGLRLSRRVVEIREQVLKGMDQHLFQAKKLEENGMIAEAERLHAQVAQSEANRELKKAVRDEKIAHTALMNTLSVDYPIEPTSPLFIFRMVPSLQDFKDKALGKNPLLKQIVAQKEAAHQGYKKEMGTFLPEAYLFGNYELYKEDLTILEPEWAVGIKLNFTLFEGKSRYNKAKAAKSLEEQVSLLETRARRDITTLIEKRYQELMKALDQFDALESSLVAAKEYLRVRTLSFEEGFATSIDVVDAQLALSKVRIERLLSVYDFDVALAELLETSGESEQFKIYQTEGEEIEVTF